MDFMVHLNSGKPDFWPFYLPYHRCILACSAFYFMISLGYQSLKRSIMKKLTFILCLLAIASSSFATDVNEEVLKIFSAKPIPMPKHYLVGTETGLHGLFHQKRRQLPRYV
jgi:hypothetical protein